MSKIFTRTFRVRWGELDPSGTVSPANHLRYLIETAWDAVSIDERWQLEQWGSDAEAEAALENRRRDFMAAARFLELLDA